MLIAEVGQNFCSDMVLAKELIRRARFNGADKVKFQLYDSVKLYGESGHSELSFDQAKELFDYGRPAGIEVFFSVFDVERVKWCEEIGVKRYKVAYSQRQNQPLLLAIAKTGKPVWISGLDFFCVPSYPATVCLRHVKFEEDILEYGNAYIFDGFSDHTIGLTAAKTAIARGCKIIEKHFAIDHETGVDAEWSMTPAELKELKDWETECRKII